MIKVLVYSRQECHLCEVALQDLKSLGSNYPHEIEIIDIDENEELTKRYALEIPIVKIGPYELKAPFTKQELEITLAAAIDRENHIERIDQSPALAAARTARGWNRSDQFTLWISNHYMALFNTLVAIYLGLAFLAPVLLRSGFDTPAKILYRGYGLVCHQLSFRSFFIFGEQLVYPREAAHVEGLRSFEQATGLSEAANGRALEAARSYLGEEGVGYKIALCERDIAIYSGILLFGLIFSMTGKRIPSLPWYLWLLFGIVPIGVDGVSQLLSQPPLNLWTFRESTPFLRVLTGGLFGFVTAWFGYPMVEETMVDTRKILASKKNKLQKSMAD